MKDQAAKEKKRKRRWSIRKVRLMLRVPERITDQRGFTAEDLCAEAGKYWKKKKIIKEVSEISRHFSPDDLDKIDLTLTHLTGKKLFCDIKTFWTEKEEKECLSKGVTLIPIGPGLEKEWIQKRLLGFIISDLISPLSVRDIREVIFFIIAKQNKPRKKHGFMRKILSQFQRVE